LPDLPAKRLLTLFGEDPRRWLLSSADPAATNHVHLVSLAPTWVSFAANHRLESLPEAKA
jgi:hypothetical protein